ncbi:hypothetical protein KIH86_09190 [Paenibacillus sp. HN-1]|uniref:hypothetical protein n=2 Tax=Paenibacillus TaxID=44249 RepID=UPI001CA866FD|nr:hypothetical protein [Paenibacillus sp. CGMCC 1.18879]MBY9079760.1 hypothetical protein [Paenibacillus sp. CGMCC 1.18879]MBY9084404.1 hypothetical protein [Paenibacillus sinensis]
MLQAQAYCQNDMNQAVLNGLNNEERSRKDIPAYRIFDEDLALTGWDDQDDLLRKLVNPDEGEIL